MKSNVWHFALRRGSRARTAYDRYVAHRPSWIARAAVWTFLLVIGLPILLLVLLASILALLVFGVLRFFAALTETLRGILPGARRDTEGRENVRIIGRDDDLRRDGG